MNSRNPRVRAQVVLDDVLSGMGRPDDEEFSTAYLVAGVIAGQLAIVVAIDGLSQTIIDKFPDRPL
jgi:hypothetical protein